MTLSACQLSVAFGDASVLDGIDAGFAATTITGLIGPNGAGKTTLLRAIAGLVAVSSGAVLLDGRHLARLRRRELARAVAYLPQAAPCAWPMQVRRVVALGRLPHLSPWRRPAPEDVRAIDAALVATDVQQLADRNVLTLSGGERARVMLARTLAVDPRYLLADEPVAGLDPEHQLQVMGLLRRRAAAGTGVAVTLHDLSLAARFCDRLIVLDRGRIAADGPPGDVLTPSVLASVFAVNRAYGRRDGQTFVVPWKVVPRLRPHVRSDSEAGGRTD